MPAELWYGAILVGRLADVFRSDGIWYATVDVAIREPVGELERKLIGYVAFCTDWNERQQGADPPDADEFDRYADVIDGGWTVHTGTVPPCVVEDPPVFFPGGEVSWREPA